MKTINKILAFIGIGVMALGTGSCVNDLDLMPSDPSTNNTGKLFPTTQWDTWTACLPMFI